MYIVNCCIIPGIPGIDDDSGDNCSNNDGGIANMETGCPNSTFEELGFYLQKNNCLFQKLYNRHYIFCKDLFSVWEYTLLPFLSNCL